MSKRDKEILNAEDVGAVIEPTTVTVVVDDSPEGVEKLREAGFTVTRDTNPGVVLCTHEDQPVRVHNGDTITRLGSEVSVTKKAIDA